MTQLGLLALPLGGLVFLTAIGAGATVGLASRLPAAAQAALFPVVGAALLACTSVLLPLGVSARLTAASLTFLGVAATLILWRQVAGALRAASWPLLVAVVAVVLAGAPGLTRGDWTATSLYESTDSYHWTSQARAYLDGPATPPTGSHPDRLTYERTQAQHWAVALPFGLLQLAWAADSDPPDVYGGFAALVFALLPLAAFAVARGLLGWRAPAAAAAGVALAANAVLLFASHFSWQQQLAGTAFALAAAGILRLALEREAGRGEPLLAALLAAAALASYRMGFAPYLGALLGAVAGAYLVSRRRSPADLRHGLGSLVVFAALAVLLAAPSLAALVRGLPDFVASGGFSTTFKRTFPLGQPGEALGLVPRIWALEEGWPAALRLTWLVLATVLAVLLLALGARVVHRVRPERTDFLVAGAALVVGGYLVLLLPAFSPYLSFKLLSYGVPFLVLLALAPLAHSRGWAPAAAAAVLVVPSAVVATVVASGSERTPGSVAALRVDELPRDAVVAVDVDDPWEQAWALYYLRDHEISVQRPSYLLTAQGSTRAAASYRRQSVDYVLRDSEGELALVRASAGVAGRGDAAPGP